MPVPLTHLVNFYYRYWNNEISDDESGDKSENNREILLLLYFIYQKFQVKKEIKKKQKFKI